VDLLPSEGLIPSYLEYPKQPIHLGHLGTRWEVDPHKKDKKTFLGGVVSFGKADFETVDGYPNNFWGWGSEDDVLNERLKRHKIDITQPTEPVIDLEELTIADKLKMLKDQKAQDERRWEKVRVDKKDGGANGLSTLEGSYEILQDTLHPSYDNVRHITVRLNITDTDAIHYD
jgi:hypothetical protein